MDQNIVIILSDGSDDEDCSVANNDSVFIVEEEKNQANTVASDLSLLDEDDLVVTYCQRAEVLPHARYDCSTHPFIATDSETKGPVDSNHMFCSQCFCYICDKVALECSVWREPGLCHCNAHKRSVYWSSRRDKVVLGYLQVFNFDLLDIDADLRLAESLLLKLGDELAVEYDCFMKGVPVLAFCSCHCHSANRRASDCKTCQLNHQHVLVHDYRRVYERLSDFLTRAESEKPRTAAVMRLGAAQHFITHKQPPGVLTKEPLEASVAEALPMLLLRVTDAVQRQIVMCDFSLEFIQKLQSFYRTLPLPLSCRSMRNSLCVLPWGDPLLVSVLRGQNVTGVRQGKGRKEFLTESPAVVLLRAERLQQENKYRELTRYLRVVQTNTTLLLQAVQDLIPLYLFKAGDFSSALSSFSNSPYSHCRLQPHLFAVYLRILTTGTAPLETVDMATKPLPLTARWELVKGAVVPKRVDVVKFGLKALRDSVALYLDSFSWASFLHVVNSSSDAPLQEPDPDFLKEAMEVTKTILLNQLIQIPRAFQNLYPDQALLLLVTQALAQRILHCPLTSALPIFNAYKINPWALKWLCSCLSSSPDVLHSFLRGVEDELQKEDGVDIYKDRVGPVSPPSLSSSEKIRSDQQSRGPFTQPHPTGTSSQTSCLSSEF